MMRCRLIAADLEGARADATAVVDAGAANAPGAIGGYCAALALLVLGRNGEAEVVAARTAEEGLEPAAVAGALGALARGDGVAYEAARVAVLGSFEERDAFLEDARGGHGALPTRSHASAGSAVHGLVRFLPASRSAPTASSGTVHRGLDRARMRHERLPTRTRMAAIVVPPGEVTIRAARRVRPSSRSCFAVPSIV